MQSYKKALVPWRKTLLSILCAKPNTLRTASTRPIPSACRMSSSVRRSEEHTSELQSQSNLVCRLLLVENNIRHEGGLSRIDFYQGAGERDGIAARYCHGLPSFRFARGVSLGFRCSCDGMLFGGGLHGW